jgi:multidrug efflux pump subunit AcrA (membrane-fusion protein)
MRTPTLKDGVEFRLEADPPLLADPERGRTLKLSAQHAAIVACFDGLSSIDDIVRVARERGAKVEKAEVEELVRDLEVEGFVSGREVAPSPLLSERVPTLRGDLQLAERPQTPGVFDVTHPDGRTFPMYDFEVSIARMLDGVRSLGEVVEASTRLGIAATPESLDKFFKQLEAYGFLTDGDAQAPGEAAHPNATFAPRATWSPQTRQLFQSALRMFRLGRLEDARQYLEALLQTDADNPDAIALRARVEERLALGPDAPAVPSFDELHRKKADRRRKWLVRALAPAAGLGLILASASLVTVPCQVSTACEIAPASGATDVRAGREGVVAELRVAQGDWVEANTVIATLDEAPVQDELLRVGQAIVSAERALAAERSAQTAREQRAAAILERREAELRAAVARRDRLLAVPRRTALQTRQLRRAETRVSRLRAQADWATRHLDQVRAGEPLRRAEQLLEARLAEKAAAQGRLASSAVVAPTAGVISFKLRSGDRLDPTTVLATLEDPTRLKVAMTLPRRDAERITLDQVVTVGIATQPDVRYAASMVSLNSASPERSDAFWHAEALIEDAPRTHFPTRAGLAGIDCGREPLGLWAIRQWFR